MKHLKHLFTAMLLLCTTFATAHDFGVDGIYYNITDETNRTVEVTSGTDGYTGSVVIPSSVTYYGTTYSVTSIGYRAFYKDSGLKSVTIPNSVTSIGYQAFEDSGLTSVTIGNSVTSIGDYAFRDCSGLESVTIPNSVTSIGNYAFSSCSILTSVTIPNSVTSIGEGAFRYCSGLTSVTIPNSVTSIGNLAFEYCTGLESITIPNSVTSIGNYAFNYCNSLTSVTIGNGVTSIGEYAFSNCPGFTSVHISDLSAWCNIEFGSYNANPLYYAKNLYLNGELLTNLIIPDGVTKIKNYAFYGCTGLTSIEIPNSVISIGEEAFEETAWYNSRPDGVVYAGRVLYKYKGDMPNNTNIKVKNGTLGIANGAFRDCTNLRSIEIPYGVTNIGESAFIKCSGLTSVTIGNGVTSIGNFTFSGCSGLTSIEIPNSVTSIGDDAFSYCDGLTSITIPNSVTSIGKSAFRYCDDLTSVTIPNSVTSIGEEAFYYCTRLKEIYVKAKTPPTVESDAFYNVPASATLYVPIGTKAAYQAADGWKDFGNIIENDFNRFEADGIYYNITDETNRTVEVTSGTDKYTGSVVIPLSVTYKGTTYSVTTIGSEAFSGCSGLTSVTIPNSVTSIGDDAFSGCDGLTSVHISDLSAWCNIEFGGNDANPLYYAKKLYLNGELLTNLIIPNGVTKIKNYAFFNCAGLTSIEIPNSVTSIGDYAFRSCSGLTSVTIPNSVTSIGSGVFCDCIGLTSIIVENGNSVYDSRENCNAIIVTATNTLIVGCKNTIIPNSVTSIGNQAFYGCSGLTSVTIPNSVTSIGGLAFYNCSGLASVTIPNSVTTIKNRTFHGCSGLKEIYVKAKTPSRINSSVFYSVPTASATLYVPIGTKAAYQVADGWKDFANIVEKDFGIKGDINGDDTVSVTDIQSVVNLILSASSAEDNPAADVNGDGTISVTDIQSVVNIILNVE